MSDLEKFLSSQRSEGQVESEGEFTIALEKARQKLQQYQLADSSFYLLKVFQAAVHAGAETIYIRLTRKDVYLWFEVPERPYPLDQTMASLGNVLGMKPSGLRHLALGLNASLVMSPEQVWWCEWHPEGKGALKIVAGVMEPAEPPKPPKWGFPSEGHSGYLLTVNKKAPSLLGPSANATEHTAVSQRCGFAPAAVILDNVRLEMRWKTKQTPYAGGSVSQPFYVGERFVLDPAGGIGGQQVSVSGYKKEDDVWLRRGRQPKSFCLQFVDPNGREAAPQKSSGLRCSGAYALPLALSGSNTATFIKDGVLMESVVIEPEPGGLTQVGAVALLDAHELQVDISEFKMIRDERFEQLLAETRAHWKTLSRACLTHLPYLKNAPTDHEVEQYRNKNSGFAAGCSCLGGCVIPIFLFGVFPVLGGSELAIMTTCLLGLVGGAATPFALNRPPNQDESLRAHVRRRLEKAHQS